jgi:hypothetical protein
VVVGNRHKTKNKFQPAGSSSHGEEPGSWVSHTADSDPLALREGGQHELGREDFLMMASR